MFLFADDQHSQKEKKKTEKKPNEKFSFKYIGGLLFAKMFKGGATELRANAEEVNKLNVFPVPDGDTGDNMSMTIDSGVDAIEDNDSDNLAEVMNVLSRGMLLGARGNSGVILSQLFAGIATGFAKSPKADAKILGMALQRGVKQAYASVMTPTEGTILTVIRESVDYAVSKITPKSTINSLFHDLVTEMHASVDSDRNYTRGDIVSYNTSRAYNRVTSYRNTAKDGNPRAKPHVVAYRYRKSYLKSLVSLLGIKRVLRGGKGAVWCDKYVISEFNLCPVKYMTVVVSKEIVTRLGVVSVVYPHRSVDSRKCAKLSEYFAKKLSLRLSVRRLYSIVFVTEVITGKNLSLQLLVIIWVIENP